MSEDNNVDLSRFYDKEENSDVVDVPSLASSLLMLGDAATQIGLAVNMYCTELKALGFSVAASENMACGYHSELLKLAFAPDKV